MLPETNYLAVLVAGIVIFILGGLWYSSMLFAKPWIAAMGRSEEELRAAAKEGSMAVSYSLVFLCGLITAWVMSLVVTMFNAGDPVSGALTGMLCWLGFAGTTSFATALFSFQPRRLWLINTGYNLVAFILAGIILAMWR